MKRYYREDFITFSNFELLSKKEQKSSLKPSAELYVKQRLGISRGSDDVVTAVQFITFPVIWKQRKVSAKKKLAYDLF